MNDTDDYAFEDGDITDSQIRIVDYAWPAQTNVAIASPSEDGAVPPILTPHILVPATSDPAEEDIDMRLTDKVSDNEDSEEEKIEEISLSHVTKYVDRKLVLPELEPKPSESALPSLRYQT